MDEKKIRKAVQMLRIEKKECKKLLDFYGNKQWNSGILRRKIEDCNTAIEALEKQLPKKVEIWNGQATCPNCKKLYGNMVDIKRLHPASWDFEYCKHCGQRFDWSE